jgi:hypothetical protein
MGADGALLMRSVGDPSRYTFHVPPCSDLTLGVPWSATGTDCDVVLVTKTLLALCTDDKRVPAAASRANVARRNRLTPVLFGKGFM